MDLQIDPHAHLRAAFGAGCRIQAWHLNDGAANSNDGRWDTLTPPEGREPEFGCAPHLYRVHPEDEAKALAAWNYQYPTMHLPNGVRFYIERLISNTDPARMVRENLQLREMVEQLSAHSIPDLDDDVRWILGRPNFACIGIANALRKGGHNIKPKAEEEQATVLHWLLGLYVTHGDAWRDEAAKALGEMQASGDAHA